MNPGLEGALSNYGRLLARTGRWTRAVPVLRGALAMDPQSGQLFHSLGLALEETGAREAAAACFARAAALVPENTDAHLKAAHNHFHLGSSAAAVRHFRAVVRLRPDMDFVQLNLGLSLLNMGRATEAASAILRYDRMVPGDHRAASSLGRCYEALGDFRAAEAWYRRSTELCPSSGENFTRHACLLLRTAFDWPRLPRRHAADPKVRASVIGLKGRFGNSILQYAFLRAYAAEFNLGYEVPEWVGRYLFDGNDPWPSAPMPMLREEDARLEDSLARREPRLYVNFDFDGHFCYNTASMARHKGLIGQALAPHPLIRPLLDRAVGRLRGMGATLVAMHLRRGDFGQEPFWIAPEAWYQDWLAAHWAELERPVLYIASDDPQILEAFRAYSPVTVRDLGETIPGADFFLDYHVLSQGDVVLISNSTFSFTATMMGAAQRDVPGRRFLRPDRERRCMVPFDPWDTDPPQVFRPPGR